MEIGPQDSFATRPLWEQPDTKPQDAVKALEEAVDDAKRKFPEAKDRIASLEKILGERRESLEADERFKHFPS